MYLKGKRPGKPTRTPTPSSSALSPTTQPRSKPPPSKTLSSRSAHAVEQGPRTASASRRLRSASARTEAEMGSRGKWELACDGGRSMVISCSCMGGRGSAGGRLHDTQQGSRMMAGEGLGVLHLYTLVGLARGGCW